MKKVEKVVLRYVTDDGEEFDTEEKALEHEYEMIMNRLYDTKLKIDSYIIYKINNKDELKVFKEKSYSSRTSIEFDINEINEFPVFICEETFEDYYIVYNKMDDVLMFHEQMVEKLKNVSKSN